MTPNTRRSFLTRYVWNQLRLCLRGFLEGQEEVRRRSELDRFFESYESSYSLTLAYPDEILIDAARQLGIKTEGRDKIQIVKELFTARGGP